MNRAFSAHAALRRRAASVPGAAGFAVKAWMYVPVRLLSVLRLARQAGRRWNGLWTASFFLFLCSFLSPLKLQIHLLRNTAVPLRNSKQKAICTHSTRFLDTHSVCSRERDFDGAVSRQAATATGECPQQGSGNTAKRRVKHSTTGAQLRTRCLRVCTS